MRAVVLIGAVLLALVCACGARELKVPNPVLEPQLCGFPSASYVCDPDKQLVSPSLVLAAVDTINEQPALCDSPYQLAIVVVRTLAAYGYKPSSKNTGVLARRLHDEYGVGFPNCQSGVLLLLALEDRNMHVSTGRDARRVVSDRIVDALLDGMKAHLRNGLVDDALLAFTGALLPVLQENREVPVEELHEGKESLLPILGFLGCIVAVLGVCSWASAKSNREYHSCSELLRRLEARREEARRAGDRFETPVGCLICLEDFPTSPEERNKRTVHLPCGHMFCTPCFEGWVKTSRKAECPLCRYNADPSFVSSAPRPSGSHMRYETDILPFQLAMLSQRYPYYVTPSMVSTWARPDHDGSFTSDVAFTKRNPANRASSSSSSRSFGGGSSSGGGGRGGSW